MTVLASLTALLTGAAPAGAASDGASAGGAQVRPPAIAGGLYKGRATFSDARCRGGCEVRLALGNDGFDLNPDATYLELPGRCDYGELSLAPIGRDGRFRTWWGTQSTFRWATVQGRFSADRRSVRGAARLPCGSRRVSMRFSARLTGRPTGGPSVRAVPCTRLTQGSLTAKPLGALVLPVVRGAGCGRAHTVARELLRDRACAPAKLASGSSCRAAGAVCRAGRDALEPAAQLICREGEGPVIAVVRLQSCGYGVEADSWLVLAGPGVGCAAANAVATREWCETTGGATCGPPSGFRCAEDREVRWSRADLRGPDEAHGPYRRCSDERDPSRVLEISDESSDSV